VSGESFSYLKCEIDRLFLKEKKCREELWINGIVKSSLMSARINPDYIGSDEVLLLIYLHLLS
jgi:histone demethylase JARID1